MRILGINNYSQPKYLNQQRKTTNIQQLQTTPDSFTFRGGYMYAVKGFDNLSNFKNLKHPENKAFYEQLKKKLHEVPYYKHIDSDMSIDYKGISEYVIRGVYNACLDANNVVNKYAAQVLFNICHVADTPAKELNIPEWRMKKEKSKAYEEWGLGGVKILLDAAKDKKGNHNLENLKLLLYLDKTYEYSSNISSLADVFRNCTNKDSVITPKALLRIKSILDRPNGWYFDSYMNKLTELDDKGMRFFNSIFDKVSEESMSESEKYRALLRDVLKYNKSEETDKVYDVLNGNINSILDNNDDSVLTRTIFYETPLVMASLNSEGQISAKNLEKLIYLLNDKEYKLYENASFLKDKNGIIRYENIKAYEKIKHYIQDRDPEYYSNKQHLTYLKDNIKGFTDEDGVMNIKFAGKLADLCEEYQLNSGNDHVIDLYNIILDFQGKDMPVDWDIVEMLCKYTRKALNENPTITTQTIAEYNDDVFQFIRDEQTKEIIPEKVEWFKKRVDIDNLFTFKSMKQIQKELETERNLREYFRENSDYGNLYTADDMLDLLRDLDDEELLNKKNILTTPIKEGDSSILMYIADILPTEENAKKYDKIIKILKDIKGVDYNYKDDMGVSFIEKVMMSENFKLLDLIKNKKVEYYPELEFAYQNIQNPEFKEGVKSLNLQISNYGKVIGKSKKIEEITESVEEEKPLLAAALKNSLNTADTNKRKAPATLEDCHTVGDVIRHRRRLTSYNDRYSRKN